MGRRAGAGLAIGQRIVAHTHVCVCAQKCGAHQGTGARVCSTHVHTDERTDARTHAHARAHTHSRARARTHIHAHECHDCRGKPPATATTPVRDSHSEAGPGLLFQGWRGAPDPHITKSAAGKSRTSLLLSGRPELSREEGMNTRRSTAGGGGTWTDKNDFGRGAEPGWLKGRACML